MPSITPPLVLVTERLAAEAERWLESRCRVVRASPDGAGVGSSGAPSGDGRSGGDGEFWSQLAVADALVVRTYTIVDEAMLARAPRLRVVGRAGVGVDNIDLVACRRRSIVVVNTPDANTQAVVEYVLCLLCDALRPRLAAGLRTAISAEAWNRMRNEVVGRRQLGECTLGVLGLGRIGRRVAEVARAIGMRVLYNDLRTIDAAERAGAVPVDDATLFADSDIVSIHIDGRPENRRFVGAALVDRMRPDVVFINTSRGFVVDHVALARFIAGHPGSLALLDVHDPEPIAADHPLLGLPNARLFPHLASRTDTALRNMSWVVRDVVAALEDTSGL